MIKNQSFHDDCQRFVRMKTNIGDTSFNRMWRMQTDWVSQWNGRNVFVNIVSLSTNSVSRMANKEILMFICDLREKHPELRDFQVISTNFQEILQFCMREDSVIYFRVSF